MRVCCALEDDQPNLQQFSKAAFDAYFAQGENIDDPAVLISVAKACGLDGTGLIAQASEQRVKDQLRSNTEEAISRGAYGSPSLFIDDSLYFGNDQLPLVEQRLTSARPRHDLRDSA
jgi:2-hydroxychromene-2-carboxylate isomerase